MSAVDFEAWAVPHLELTLGGRTYRVPPPTVGAAKQIIAAAVRGEVNLGLVKGPIPDEVQAALDTIGVDDHPAITSDVYEQMVADGVPKVAIDRAAYYCVFYWARSRQYADMLAALLWTPRETSGESQSAADAPREA